MPDSLEIETPEGLSNLKLGWTNILITIVALLLGWAFAGGSKSASLDNLKISVDANNVSIQESIKSMNTKLDSLNSSYLLSDKATALQLATMKAAQDNLENEQKILQSEINNLTNSRK